MIKEFRDFLLRGNVVDLAVASSSARPSARWCTSFDGRHPDAAARTVRDVRTSDSSPSRSATATVKYGLFLNALISFVLVAAAIFFFVVKPMNMLERLRQRGQEPPSPTTKTCTECASEIPLTARRAARCAPSRNHSPETRVALRLWGGASSRAAIRSEPGRAFGLLTTARAVLILRGKGAVATDGQPAASGCWRVGRVDATSDGASGGPDGAGNRRVLGTSGSRRVREPATDHVHRPNGLRRRVRGAGPGREGLRRRACR